jgi:TldD protein
MFMIKDLIQSGLEFGADFVDVFREECRRAVLSLKDGKVESVSAGTDFGYGIRMICGEQVLYVESSKDDFGHLRMLMKNLALAHDWSTSKSSSPIVYSAATPYKLDHIAQWPAKYGQSPKKDYCLRADKAARDLSNQIKQVSVSALDETQNILIANSEGLWEEDCRVRCRMSISVTAGDGQELATGSETPGAMAGMEFFENLNIEQLSQQAAQRALLMLDSGYIEGGKMPVIIGKGFGGVIFHEACGHPLETEAIRRKASPFVGKLQQQIAHPCLTAIDDGTLEGVWGSLRIDDEGTPTQRTTLIEKGVLKCYLSDRVGARQLGVPLTGSARRESFRYSPVSRMRNTFIDNGEHSVDQLLSSVEDGLYAKVMGGGSVNPSTGEFNFSVQEGYRIRNGKIAEPVRGATLIGKGHEVMPKISMVANDLALSAGMCGASSGSVPVTVGQPTLRVDEILVGGR